MKFVGELLGHPFYIVGTEDEVRALTEIRVALDGWQQFSDVQMAMIQECQVKWFAYLLRRRSTPETAIIFTAHTGTAEVR